VRARGAGPIEGLMDVWHKRAALGPVFDAPWRDRVVQLWIESEVLRLTNMRARVLATTGTPGPGGSVGKLLSAELNKKITECALDLLGANGMVFEAGYPMDRPEHVGFNGPDPARLFLRMRAQSIEGGTSEVMRNILGERVLGLPKEPSVDRDLPWSAIPRN